MKRLLIRLHDKLFGEPTYYAIYDKDGKNLIALSVNWFLVKFGNDKELIFCERKDCEAIYADEYYYDPSWMTDCYEWEGLNQAVVKAVGQRRFDKLWDEWFTGFDD